MACDEALVLKWAHSQGDWAQHNRLNLEKAQVELGFTPDQGSPLPKLTPRMATCVDGLEAEQLIRRNYFNPGEGDFRSARFAGQKPISHRFRLTERGGAFIDACTPPKPQRVDARRPPNHQHLLQLPFVGLFAAGAACNGGPAESAFSVMN
jgi:hypothetical protein